MIYLYFTAFIALFITCLLNKPSIYYFGTLSFLFILGPFVYVVDDVRNFNLIPVASGDCPYIPMHDLENKVACILSPELTHVLALTLTSISIYLFLCMLPPNLFYRRPPKPLLRSLSLLTFLPSFSFLARGQFSQTLAFAILTLAYTYINNTSNARRSTLLAGSLVFLSLFVHSSSILYLLFFLSLLASSEIMSRITVFSSTLTRFVSSLRLRYSARSIIFVVISLSVAFLLAFVAFKPELFADYLSTVGIYSALKLTSRFFGEAHVFRFTPFSTVLVILISLLNNYLAFFSYLLASIFWKPSFTLHSLMFVLILWFVFLQSIPFIVPPLSDVARLSPSIGSIAVLLVVIEFLARLNYATIAVYALCVWAVILSLSSAQFFVANV